MFVSLLLAVESRDILCDTFLAHKSLSAINLQSRAEFLARGERACSTYTYTMRKSLRATPPGLHLVFSFILLQANFQGDFSSRSRRCSHRRAICDDASYAIAATGLAPISRITHSKYSSPLFFSREKERETELYRSGTRRRDGRGTMKRRRRRRREVAKRACT